MGGALILLFAGSNAVGTRGDARRGSRSARVGPGRIAPIQAPAGSLLYVARGDSSVTHMSL